VQSGNVCSARRGFVADKNGERAQRAASARSGEDTGCAAACIAGSKACSDR
jgi:hypothetical protein